MAGAGSGDGPAASTGCVVAVVAAVTVVAVFVGWEEGACLKSRCFSGEEAGVENLRSKSSYRTLPNLFSEKILNSRERKRVEKIPKSPRYLISVSSGSAEKVTPCEGSSRSSISSPTLWYCCFLIF